MAYTSSGASMGPARSPGVACRINTLPDDILCRAISHLDARQLVQTCLLSRLWRGLWHSVRRINASCQEFNGMAGTKKERDVLFKKFVNHFLTFRKPTDVHEFNLWYPMPDGVYINWDPSADDANQWIGHALQSNARSVKVSGWDSRLCLNPAVFASNCILTNLELSRVALLPGFFENLQTGCTALERLALSDCAIRDVQISSQTLKVLVMDSDCNFSFAERASISIPGLIDLGFFIGERLPLLTDMGSLVTASVSVGNRDTQNEDICQFLSGFSGVTNLDFSYEGATLNMEKNLQWCPKFNNLAILALGQQCLHGDFYVLIVFLKNSPNLVKLILNLRKESLDIHQNIIGELEERSFSCKELKVVQIVCSEGSENDPVFNSLETLLLENGITSSQIGIMR